MRRAEVGEVAVGRVPGVACLDVIRGQFSLRHQGPNTCVRILPAVFADARWVGLDVARARLSVDQGRVQQLDQTRLAVNQICIHSRHGHVLHVLGGRM